MFTKHQILAIHNTLATHILTSRTSKEIDLIMTTSEDWSISVNLWHEDDDLSIVYIYPEHDQKYVDNLFSKLDLYLANKITVHEFEKEVGI